MEARQEANPAPDGSSGSSIRGDAARLAILLLLAASLRFWLVSHTEVMARDGVGFIRYARQLDSQPWTGVLRENAHPPVYPLTILGVSHALRHFVHGDDVFLMQLSAQVASSLAGILLVVPVFYLGKELFDQRVGFWSAAIFQCLPAAARVLADALSEAVFLLLVATALLFAVRAIRGYSWRGFALSGAFTGLAYLTRPEGVMLAGAVLGALVALQVARRNRQPWRQLGLAALSLAAATAVVAAPYVAVIQRFTNKPAGLEVLHASAMPAIERADADVVTHGLAAHRSGSFPAPLAVFWFDIKERPSLHRLVWGIQAVGMELLRGFHYVAAALAVIGIFRSRKQLGERPGTWVVVFLCAMYVAILWRVAYVAGYVADRHTLVIVLCGMMWAVGGAIAVGGWMRTLCQRPAWSAEGALGGFRRRLGRMSAGQWSVLLLGAVGVSALPKSLEPLHTNRAGYHAAGLWLAKHAEPTDVIWDPFSWAEYYSGRTLTLRPPPAGPDTDRFCQYVVLGCSDNEHVRLPMIPIAEALATQGTVVYRWADTAKKRKAEEVVIYRVEPREQSSAVQPPLTDRKAG